MKITVEGFKGYDQEVALGPRTLLQGPNGSGKSTIADAVRLAALGVVPSLGKHPHSVTPLMRGREARVEIVLDDGRSFSRNWAHTKKGLTCEARCSWVEGDKSEEHAAAILGLFGADKVAASECLDIREILSLTANQRTARLRTLLSSDFVLDEIADFVARQAAQRLTGVVDERVPDDWTEILTLMSEAHRAKMREIWPMLRSLLQRVKITGALSWANETKRTEHNALKLRLAARAELEARVEALPPEADGQVQSLVGYLDQLQASLGAARERQRLREETVRRREAAQTQLTNAKLAVVAAIEAQHGLAPDLAKRAGVQAELAAAESELAAVPAISQAQEDPTVAELRERAVVLDAQADGVEIVEITIQIDGLEAMVAQARADALRAQSNPWSEVRMRAKSILAALPFTVEEGTVEGRIASEAHGLLNLADRQAPDEAHTSSSVSEGEAWLTAARNQLRQQQSEREQSKMNRVGLRRQAEHCRKTASELEETARRNARSGSATNGCKRKALTERVEQLRQSLRQLADREAAGQVAIDKALAAELAAQTRLDDLGPVGEEINTTTIESEIARVKVELQTRQGADAVRAELQQVIAEISRLQVSYDVFVAVEWALQRAAEKEVSEAGASLRSAMQRFLSAGGAEGLGVEDCVPFFRAQKETCDLGWRHQDGTEVLVSAMSGGEWVLYTAALTTAVLLERQVPVRILIVEASECDLSTVRRLAVGIEAVAADLTAAVVLTHNDQAAEQVGDGWDVLTPEQWQRAAA